MMEPSAPGLVPVPWIPPLLYLASALAFLGLRRPPAGTWGVSLFLLYSGIWGYLSLVSGLDSRVRLSASIILVCLVAGALPGVLRREGTDRITGMLGTFVALHVLQALNPWWSSPVRGILSAAAGGLAHLAPMGLYVVGEGIAALPGARRHVIEVITFVGALTAAYALVECAAGPGYQEALGPAFAATTRRENLWLPRPATKPISFGRSAGQAAVASWAGVLGAMGLMAAGPGGPAAVALLITVLAGSAAVLFSLVRTWIAGLGLGVLLSLARTRSSLLWTAVLVVLVLGLVHVLSHGVVTDRIRAAMILHELQGSRSGVLISLGTMVVHHPFGLGPGRVGPGSEWFKGLADLQHVYSTEAYPVAIWLEYGFLGALLMGALLLEVLRRSLAGYRKLPPGPERTGHVMVLVLLGVTPVAPVGYGWPACLYLWLLAGLGAGDPRADRSAEAGSRGATP